MLRLIVLLVIVALAAPVVGQATFEEAETNEDAVHAPVQLLLDQFPELMELAIQEATLDATPDDARALVAQMEAFFAAFDGQEAWPEDSVAAESNARTVYATVSAILSVAKRVPGTIATLAVVDAECIEAEGRASANEARIWLDDAFTGIDDLDFYRTQLLAFADRLPAPLDPTPVRLAIDGTNQWMQHVASEVEVCLTELFIELGIEHELTAYLARRGGGGEDFLSAIAAGGGVGGAGVPEIRIELAPPEVYPGQVVVVSGRIYAISADLVTWTSSFGPSGSESTSLGGFFVFHLRVPESALPGTERVTVQASHYRETATLNIVKAPTTLRLSGPESVLPGGEYFVRASVSSPLELPETDKVFIDGKSGLARSFRLDLNAPEVVGTVTITATYPGGPRHETAWRSITFPVRLPDELDEEPERVWNLKRDVWLAPIEQNARVRDTFQIPTDSLAGLGLLAGILAAFFVLDIVLSARRKPPQLVDDAPAPVRVLWPRSFTRSFARIADQLIASRSLPQGATPRDVARHLTARQIHAGALVTDFERIRYGGGKLQVPELKKRTSWLKRVWRRLT